MKVGIYARLSQNRDGNSTSIDRQVAACRQRMEDGWTEVAIYRDDDVSAYSGKARPGFEQMLSDVAQGKVDIIIAYALDRLGRRPKDIERLLDSRARFLCVRDNLDSKGASSELFVRILAAMAKMESDNTAARIRLKHDELKAKGLPNGGRVYGWKPEEAELLQRAADLLISGTSLRQVALTLGMDRTSLRRRLISPRMVGRRTPNGPVGMPVILDEDSWRKVQRILTDPSRPVRASRGKHMLSGLLACALCDKSMLSHRVRGRRRYACYRDRGGCGKTAITAEALEQYINKSALEYAWKQYHKQTFAPKIVQPEDDQLEAQIVQLRERLYPLMDMYTAGKLSLSEWQRAREGLDGQIIQLEAKLQARRTIPNTSVLEVTFTTGDPREWLARVIDRVIIHPAKARGRRFDPSRVEIKWCI